MIAAWFAPMTIVKSLVEVEDPNRVCVRVQDVLVTDNVLARAFRDDRIVAHISSYSWQLTSVQGNLHRHWTSVHRDFVSGPGQATGFWLVLSSGLPDWAESAGVSGRGRPMIATRSPWIAHPRRSSRPCETIPELAMMSRCEVSDAIRLHPAVTPRPQPDLVEWRAPRGSRRVCARERRWRPQGCSGRAAPERRACPPPANRAGRRRGAGRPRAPQPSFVCADAVSTLRDHGLVLPVERGSPTSRREGLLVIVLTGAEAGDLGADAEEGAVALLGEHLVWARSATLAHSTSWGRPCLLWTKPAIFA